MVRHFPHFGVDQRYLNTEDSDDSVDPKQALPFYIFDFLLKILFVLQKIALIYCAPVTDGNALKY